MIGKASMIGKSTLDNIGKSVIHGREQQNTLPCRQLFKAVKSHAVLQYCMTASLSLTLT